MPPERYNKLSTHKFRVRCAAFHTQDNNLFFCYYCYHHNPIVVCSGVAFLVETMSSAVLPRRVLPVTAAAAAAVLVVLWVSSDVGPLHLAFGDHKTNSNIFPGAPEGFGPSPKGAEGVLLEQEAHRALVATGGVPGEGLLFAVANSDEADVDEFGDEQEELEAEAEDGAKSSTGGGGGASHVRHWHKALQPLNRRVGILEKYIHTNRCRLHCKPCECCPKGCFLFYIYTP